MKTRRFFLSVVFCFTLLGNAKEKHLFILSGQSNMALMRPAVSFTPTVKKSLGNDNVIIVHHAKGTKEISRWYKKWKPAKGPAPQGTGEIYDELMAMVKQEIKGKKIATVTFLWMQGERDAKLQYGDVYLKSLKGVMKQLSDDLGRDDINLVVGRINDFGMSNKSHPHWTKVRDAQVKIAESMPNAAWIDTDDLNGKANGIHATGHGYKVMGRRFAEKALELLKK